jgi:autotransporter translocation and assembly factor TamB
VPVRKGLAASGGFLIAAAVVGAAILLTIRQGGPAVPFAGGATGEGPIAGFEARIDDAMRRWDTPTAPLAEPVSAVSTSVRWTDLEGRAFLDFPSVRLTLEANELLQGRIRTRSGRLDDPSVILVKPSEDALWNYQDILEAQAGDRAAAPAGDRAVLLNTVVRGGQILLQLPDTTFTLREVEGELARIAVPAAEPANVTVTADRFAMAIRGEDESRPFLPVQASDGRIEGRDGRYAFDVAAMDLEGVRMAGLSGTWNPEHGGYGITGTAASVAVRFGVAARHFPALPDTGAATFAAALEAVPGGATRATLTSLEVEGPGSEMRGSMTVVLPPDTGAIRTERIDLALEPLDLAFASAFVDSLPFGGVVRGTVRGDLASLRIDLAAALEGGRLAQPLSTRVEGTVSLDGAGSLALDDADLYVEELPLASLAQFLPALPALSGTATGDIRLTGGTADGVLPLDVRLEVAGGVISMTGTVDAGEDVLRYDLRGNLLALPLDSVIARPVPPVNASGTFAARGQGTDPRTMDTDAAVDLTFTSWLTDPGDGLEASVLVRGGRVSIRTLELDLATLSAEGDGTWRFTDPVEGEVTIRTALEDLTPFRPYVPPTGFDGGATVVTRLSGPLDSMRVAGRADAENLRVAGWAVESGGVDYDMVLGWPLPRLQLEAEASGLRSSALGTFDRFVANVDLDRPDFSADLRMDHADGGLIELATEGTLRVRAGEARLRTLRMELENQRWALQAPTRLEWGDSLGVDSMFLRQTDGPGRFLVHGAVRPEGGVQILVDVDQLPIEQVGRLAGTEPPFAGFLSGDVTIGGTPSEPAIAGELTLRDGRVGGLALSSVESEVAYEAGLLRLRLDGAMPDPPGSLSLTAGLPLDLSLRPLVASLDRAAPLEAELHADRFPLATFRPFLPRGVHELVGDLRGDVTVAGSIDAPELRGEAGVEGVALHVDGFGRAFEQGSLLARFDGPRIEIVEAAIHSDGWGRATGTILLSEEGGPPGLDLDVTLEGIRPIAFEETQAVASRGSLQITGDLERPVVRGNLAIEDGTVILPAQGPGAALEDEIAGIADAGPITLGDLPDAADRDATATNQLSVAGLALTIGENTWFEVEDARAQMQGSLTVDMFPPDVLRLTGTLTGERGTFTLVAGPVVRRFDVIDATIRFIGLPQPNPALDITAARDVAVQGGGQLQIQARITGTLERPTLALTTETGQTIPEADLLSFLVFGQPGGAGVPGRTALQGVFLGGLGDVFGGFLEDELVDDLGIPLDLFQIRFGSGLGGGTFETLAPTVVIGKEVIDNVFITADLGIGTLFDPAATQTGPTWALTVDWRIDPQWTAQAGFEPFNRRRVLRTITGVRTLVNPRQEAFAELRRRWTY